MQPKLCFRNCPNEQTFPIHRNSIRRLKANLHFFLQQKSQPIGKKSLDNCQLVSLWNCLPFLFMEYFSTGLKSVLFSRRWIFNVVQGYQQLTTLLVSVLSELLFILPDLIVWMRHNGRNSSKGKFTSS